MKDVELCLSNRWVIRKESLENGKLTLSIKENPEFIEGFWDVGITNPILVPEIAEMYEFATIGNISVIVGSNGIGKTRLMRLMWILSTGQALPIGSKVVAVFQDRGCKEIICTSNYIEDCLWSISNAKLENKDNLLDLTTIVFSFKQCGAPPTFQEGPYFAQPIYFSQSFNGQTSIEGIDRKLGADVSFATEFFNWLSLPHANGSRKGFSDKQFKDQVGVLLDLQDSPDFRFGSVNSVIVQFSPFERRNLQIPSSDPPKKQTHIDGLFSWFEKELRQEVKKSENKPNGSVDLAVTLFRVGMLLFRLEDLTLTLFHKWHEEFWRKVEDNTKAGIALSEFSDLVLELIELSQSPLGIAHIDWEIHVDEICKLITQLPIEFIELNFGPQRELRGFRLCFNFQIAANFIDHMVKIKSIRFNQGLPSTDSDWRIIVNKFPDYPIEYRFDPSLSTGEQAILTQLSHLNAGFNLSEFYLIGKIGDNKASYSCGTSNKGIGRSFLLLIDEGDSNVHPNMQRKYIEIILHYLARKSRMNIDIQIVFTTHSALILSDFPGHCVHRILSKDDLTKVKEKGLDPLQKPRTFGANLHTLLKDDFFLDDTIGKFARTKLEWVVKRISGEVSWEEGDEEKADRIIKMLGEPVLKERLENYRKFQKARMDGKSVIDEIRRDDRKSKTKDDGSN